MRSCDISSGSALFTKIKTMPGTETKFIFKFYHVTPLQDMYMTTQMFFVSNCMEDFIISNWVNDVLFL